MKQISINDLIQCLKTSDLCKTFESDTIDIPERYFRDWCINDSLLDIQDEKQLYDVLEILRFWMANEFPPVVYNFVQKNKNIDLNQFEDLLLTNELKLLNNKSLCDEEKIGIAAEKNYLSLIKYLDQQGCKWNAYAFYCAAKAGNLKILTYLYKNNKNTNIGKNYEWDTWNNMTLIAASLHGHLDCLKYAHENGCKWNGTPFEGAISEQYIFIYDITYNKYLENSRTYISQNNFNCYFNTSCAYSAYNNHMDCFTYALENNCPITEVVSICLANHGNLKEIKMIHNKGCLFHHWTLSAAIHSKNIELVKYLIQNKHNTRRNQGFGDPFNSSIGNLECLTYTYSQGYNLTKKCTQHAAFTGQLDCIKYLRNNGLSFQDLDLLACCVPKNNPKIFECFKYLYEQGCSTHKEICDRAIAFNDFDMIKYIHKYICSLPVESRCTTEYCLHTPWTESTVNVAAANGNLQIMKYLHKHMEKPIKWTPTTCKRAVTFNNLEMLKYLHENECQWDKKTIELAVEFRNLECLQYAIENKCEIPEDLCRHLEKGEWMNVWIYNSTVQSFDNPIFSTKYQKPYNKKYTNKDIKKYLNSLKTNSNI